MKANKLPLWVLNGGSRGGNGPLLQLNEFDGYLTIADSTDSIHVAWQVLPHRAAEIKTKDTVSSKKRTLELENESAVLDGGVDLFDLTGTSKRIPKAYLPGPGDNFAVVDLRAVGIRPVVIGGTADAPVYGLQFGITTYGQRAHPNYPAEFDVYIDVNSDGTDDFVVYNAEAGGFASTGQNVVYLVNLATGAGGAYFYTDADLNSSNAILTAPMGPMGITPDSKLTFSVYAFDNYFTGNLTDAIEGMVYTPSTPKYAVTDAKGAIADPQGEADFAVPAHKDVDLKFQSIAGGKDASPSQEGFLLLYRDAQPGREATPVIIRKSGSHHD